MHSVIYLIPCWSHKLLGKKLNWYKIQYVFKHLGWWKSEDGLDLWLTFPSDRRGAAASAGSWWCGWTTGRRASCIYSSPSPCFWRGWGLSWGSSVVSTTRSKTSVLTLVIRENNSRDCTCSLKITCDRNCDVLSLIIFLSNFCKKKKYV